MLSDIGVLATAIGLVAAAKTWGVVNVIYVYGWFWVQSLLHPCS